MNKSIKINVRNTISWISNYYVNFLNTLSVHKLYAVTIGLKTQFKTLQRICAKLLVASLLICDIIVTLVSI